jgi:hypothetical protein
VKIDNDRPFLHPTQQAVDQLHDRYGVDWLFLDKRFKDTAPRRLAKYADLEFTSGDYAVYRVR